MIDKARLGTELGPPGEVERRGQLPFLHVNKISQHLEGAIDSTFIDRVRDLGEDCSPTEETSSMYSARYFST